MSLPAPEPTKVIAVDSGGVIVIIPGWTRPEADTGRYYHEPDGTTVDLRDGRFASGLYDGATMAAIHAIPVSGNFALRYLHDDSGNHFAVVNTFAGASSSIVFFEGGKQVGELPFSSLGVPPQFVGISTYGWYPYWGGETWPREGRHGIYRIGIQAYVSGQFPLRQESEAA